jgi:Flp pilus assembly protein TadG
MAQSQHVSGRGNPGQVLAFFALVLPAVLLPVAAYAVDATIVASRAAGLQAATAQAAETAAQQLDVSLIRSSGALAVNTDHARLAAARIVTAEEPGASVEATTVNGVDVTVVTTESVTVPFSLFTSVIHLHARATARMAVGYDSPSSRMPLPSSTF